MAGLFDNIKKEAKMAANTISKEANYLATQASHAYNENRSSEELNKFKTNNVLQLVSRSSGRCLQIVTNDSGQLVVDGIGKEGADQLHTLWTVVDDGKNIVKLHNNFNFLAIDNGTVYVKNCNPNPNSAGAECKFRLSQNGRFILFESVKENGLHIGILGNGELKSALATGAENDAHFAIRIIYRPSPPPPAPAPQRVYVQPGSTVTVVQHQHQAYGQPAQPPPYRK